MTPSMHPEPDDTPTGAGSPDTAPGFDGPAPASHPADDAAAVAAGADVDETRPLPDDDGIDDAELVPDTPPAEESAESWPTAPEAAVAAAAAAATVAGLSGPGPASADEPPVRTPEPANAPVAPKRRSLAGRVLTLLVLLVAGGALALWGGPKLAPMLPPSMAPVAAFLTPGGDRAMAEVAALRAELEAKINGIPVGLTSEDARALVAEGVASVTASLTEAEAARKTAEADQTARIAALSDKITASDSGVIESRLAQAEVTVGQVAGQLEALNSRLTGVATEGGQITEQTISQLVAFHAEVDGLKAGVAEIAGKLGVLSQRVDEVAAASERRATEAEDAAEVAAAAAAASLNAASLDAAVTELGARLAAGDPFATPLADIASLTGQPADPVLAAAAETGAPTILALQRLYPDAAHAAIRAEIKSEGGEGIFGKASAFLSSQVASRSLTEQEGAGTDAVLSRIQARLAEGKLDAVLAEAATLTEAARAPLAGFLTAVEGRLAAEKSYAALRASVPKPVQ